MTEDIDIQKLKNDYPEFFEQFSPELLEFIFSKKTSSKIAEICSENGIEDEEKVEKIAYRVTLILLNQIPKENLTKVLIKGVGLDFNTANQISLRVDKLIFSQVPKVKPEEVQKEKPVIAEILGLKKLDETKIEKEKIEPIEKTSLPTKEEKPKKLFKKDIYQEPAE